MGFSAMFTFQVDNTNRQTLQGRTGPDRNLRQWGAGNVYLLVMSSWQVNFAENPIAVMGL